PVPNNTTFNCVLPSDCDGAFPAYGTPNYFWAIGDDAWDAYSYDRLLVWEFHVDWITPANSTWTGPTAIATAAFDATFNGWAVHEITQPGTSQEVDCIPWILMFRPQFRNFGSYWSLVCNHSVDVDATNHAGVRWYELRKSGGGWYIRQQNTYAPDGDNRWMGSVAMNAAGDIALGYSVSSTTTYPSIRFTGRLADDPLHSMTFTESNIWTGTHSQTDNGRWGDYSMMSVDPVNDHSFWYISEYNGSYGGDFDWVTQVAAFTLDDYCAASGGCSEYISNVSIGSINNSTVCEEYSNYTSLSTDIHYSSTEALTVTVANIYPGDYVSVWVDWNNDDDFYDANELIGTDNTVPFGFTIDPPTGVMLGEHRMRIRLHYSASVNPCGVFGYGEVEDYTINVIGTPGLWTGTISTNWSTAGNWDDLTVPNSSINVTIPASTPYQPEINNGEYAYCKNLTINSGAVLTQNGTSYFYVYGNLDSDLGTFTQAGLAYLYFDGAVNNTWDDDNMDDTYQHVRIYKDGPTYYTFMWQDMTVEQSFEIREGEFKIDGIWTLTVNGAIANAFEVEDGGTLTLIDETINVVNGDIQFYEGSQASVSGGTINCGDDFRIFDNTAFDIQFTGGTLNMNGVGDQYIEVQDAGSFINDLVVNKSSGVCIINYGDLDINGSMTIGNGTLNPNTYTINVSGNWTNSVGDAGFNQTTGRVIFDGGNYHQYCSNETFNELEINKPLGGAFRMNGTNVECAAYDWTAGAIDVIPGGGSFTALDLLDNGIYGAFYLNSGGTINLANYGGDIDLGGELHIFGGTMNVYGGGSYPSYWPFANDAVIEMDDGILDFHDKGIYINYLNPALNLTVDITGGVIRTSQGFEGNRPDFTPTAGTFEFYGSGDYPISQTNNCTLFNVLINKAAKDEDLSSIGNNINTVINNPEANYSKSSSNSKRSKVEIEPGGKSNTISLNSDFVVTGNLDINAGSLNLNGFQLGVAGEVEIYGQLIMINPTDEFIAINSIKWYSGATADVTTGEFYIGDYFMFYPGSNVQIGTGNTIYLVGSGETSIFCSSAGCEVGNVQVDMSSGTSYCHAGSTEPIYVAGDMTVITGNYFRVQSYDLIINGVLDIQDGATMDLGSYISGGYLETNSDFTLNGELIVDDITKDNVTNKNIKENGAVDTEFSSITTIKNTDLAPGEVYVHGHYNQAGTGILSILGGGTFICDQPTTSMSYVAGTFNLDAGLFEISNNHISMSASTAINGGTIRTGGSFIANVDGNFQPSGGIVEFIGNGATGQYILLHANNYFYDVIINRTNTIMIYTGYDLNIKNDFTILSGGLNTNTRDMYVGGDWDNTVGTNAFLESTGKVVLNGPGPAMQYVYSDEHFNVLENNTNQAIRVNSLQDTVECNSYNWISGGVSVAYGAFIANDLAQNGLYGNWYALTGSKIHLHQDGSDFIDLFGNVLIYGNGLIRVYGGMDESYWCSTAPTTVEINSGGTFDFVDYGITIWETNSLTYSIYGGIIRTGGHFTCRRNDFNPTGGTFEFYGGNDNYINMFAGSDLENVIINKSGGDKSQYTYADRDGKILNGSKSNRAYINYNNLDITGNLEVDAGQFDLYGHTLNCYGDVNVNNGGMINLQTTSVLALDNLSELHVNSGGSLTTIGSIVNEPLITHISGYYDLVIENGGTIGAEHTVFEYMSTAGVNLLPGSIVNSVNTFNNCTFRNGQSGGRLMTVDNSQTFNVNDAVFPANTWGGANNVYKSVNSGTVNFVNATGAFSGESYDNDPFDRINWAIPSFDLDLKVLLEGAFNSSTWLMDTDINGIIPNNHPYNPTLPYFGNPMPDWYYTGSESAPTPNAIVVDWVIVELRDATSAAAATPGTMVAQQAAFLLNNGQVVDLDGSSLLNFTATINNNLYVAVWHKNHLGIISMNSPTFASGTYTYDFSTGPTKALGGTGALKYLGVTGRWGMMVGDGDGDGFVLMNDINNVWSVQTGTSGYLESDYNMNTEVSNQDKNDFWLPNEGEGSFIPE
ncbi:MAG: hypothetical protein K8R74_10775, partial [Bacteroidales bacterium]|nr:hypothetical protein [Bacteroidales bacterium]